VSQPSTFCLPTVPHNRTDCSKLLIFLVDHDKMLVAAERVRRPMRRGRAGEPGGQGDRGGDHDRSAPLRMAIRRIQAAPMHWNLWTAWESTPGNGQPPAHELNVRQGGGRKQVTRSAAERMFATAIPGTSTPMKVFVLVGGWPAAGKTTVAHALRLEMGLDSCQKDEVKEALMDRLGTPSTVDASRELGGAAVYAVLRTAMGCLERLSTVRVPLLVALYVTSPGRASRSVVGRHHKARERYRRRIRDERHLDALRSEENSGQPRLRRWV